MGMKMAGIMVREAKGGKRNEQREPFIRRTHKIRLSRDKALMKNVRGRRVKFSLADSSPNNERRGNLKIKRINI